MIEEFGVSSFKAILINDQYTIFEKAIGDKEKPEEDAAARMKVVRTTDFMNRMAEKFKGRTIDLIPQNCRYLETINGGKILVIEEPPQIRTISTSVDVTYAYESLKTRGLVEEYGYTDFFKSFPKKPAGDYYYRFTLAFPYLIFIFRLSDKNEYSMGKVFFRKKPLLGLGEILFKAPLYNINAEQGLCIGHDDTSDHSSSSINEGCKKILNRFWNASFNQDYNSNIGEYKNTRIINNFFDWEYQTRQNPMFIYNIDLIPNNHGKKLVDELKYFRGETGDNPNGRSIFSFQNLTQAFDAPVLSESITKDPVYGNDIPLMENIAHGIMNKAGQTADVGDRLKFKNQEFIIESFLGPEGGYEPTHVKMYNSEAKESQIFKLTSGFKQKVFEGIFEYRLIEKLLVSDVEISKSDIVLMKKTDGKEFYKRVEYIRRNIDGIPEIKLGDDFLTPSMFTKSFVKRIEIDSIEFRGDKIKQGDQFYLIKTIAPEIPLVTIDEGTYDGPSVSSGTIGLSFKLSKISGSLSGNSTNFMNLNLLSQHEKSIDAPIAQGTIIKENETIDLPPLFRYFRNLYRTKYSFGTSKVKAVRNKYIMLQYNDPIQNGLVGETEKVTKLLFVDDSLVVNSYDVDLVYKVGEKVIVADWENPDKLLIPKTITGFKTDMPEKTNSINVSFVLADKQGNLEVAPFITHDGKIAAGRIRKIVPEINGIKAGTKIIAKETSIYCFPKKDVNIIVGFLVDTIANEPQVLCSNGLTLWLSDLKHFTMIPFTSRKWKTLEHVPIVDQYNIKLQPGDVVKGNAGYGIDDFLVFKHIEAKATLRAMLFSYFHSYAESISITNNFRYSVSFDCIPNPRVSNSDTETLGYVTGYSNLFGGVNINPLSTQQFIADPRSIVK